MSTCIVIYSIRAFADRKGLWEQFSAFLRQYLWELPIETYKTPKKLETKVTRATLIPAK